MTRRLQLLESVASAPWSIDQDRAPGIVAELVNASGADGEHDTRPPVRMATAAHANDDGQAVASGTGVAVISVGRTIVPRSDFYFGVSCEAIADAVQFAMSQEAIGAVVFDGNSPGGITWGVEELFATLLAHRGKKPMIWSANHLTASAAYWLAAACDQIVASPSADVGSIGVWTMHIDLVNALEQAGINVEIIRSGEHKIENNPFEPLSDSARAHIQASTDAVHEAFLRDIAIGRGLEVEDVRENFGKGRVFNAEQALKVGMIDRIATISQVLTEVTGNLQAQAAGRRSRNERRRSFAFG